MPRSRGMSAAWLAFAVATAAVAVAERHYDADLDKYSHSQLGEETVVLQEFFEEQGRVFVEGTFVELGALDGNSLSNTLTLQHALDWSGVLIEACPTHWPVLKARARKRQLPRQREQLVQTVESAVCHPKPPGGFIPFSAQCGPGSGVKDGVSRGDILMQLARARDENAPVNVPCHGLTHILRSHGVRHVDFLSIDVEGYEVPLLRSMDFNKTSVYAIVIEIDHNGPDEVSEIHEILSHAGFDLVGLLAGDAIWVRPSALKHSAGYWAVGKATRSGWRGRQRGQALIRPGTGLNPRLRSLHSERDARNETTGFLRYVERVTEGLPLRKRTPPPQW